MTTKSLRYESFECDICHKKEKIEIVQNENNEFVYDCNRSFTISGTAWTTIDLRSCPETKKPDPIKLEMCYDCNMSFNKWRKSRE